MGGIVLDMEHPQFPLEGEFWNNGQCKVDLNARLRAIPEQALTGGPVPPVETWTQIGAGVPTHVWRGGRLHPITVNLSEVKLTRGDREHPGYARTYLEVSFPGAAIDPKFYTLRLPSPRLPSPHPTSPVGGRVLPPLPSKKSRPRTARRPQYRLRGDCGVAGTLDVEEFAEESRMATGWAEDYLKATGGLPGWATGGVVPQSSGRVSAAVSQKVLHDRYGTRLGVFTNESDLFPFHGRTMTVRELLRSCGCSVKIEFAQMIESASASQGTQTATQVASWTYTTISSS